MIQKIYWRIEQHICGTTLHVNKELMQGLGFAGAKDYYACKASAQTYANRYANACVRCGMSSEPIFVVAGTFE